MAPGSQVVPPNLRQFVRALDEKVLNAMQETVVNVLRFFLQGEAQLPVKRKALVGGRACREMYCCTFSCGGMQWLGLCFFLQGEAQLPAKRKALVSSVGVV